MKDALLTLTNVSSNTTFAAIEIPFILPEPVRVTLATLGIVYTLVGLPGNILTITAIVKVKALRTRLNLLIVNLCITDIVSVGYLYPFVTLDLILGRPPVPLLWCQINLAVYNTVLPAADITMLLISLSRYVRILHEWQFERYFTKTLTIVYCVSAWVPGVLLAMFNMTHLSAIHYQHNSRMCFVRSNAFKLGKVMGPPILVTSYLCVMFCYWRVGRALYKHGLVIRSHGNEAFSKMRLDANKRLTAMTFLIFVCYICMTLPSLVTYGAELQEIGWSHIAALSLAFSNSIVNCLVYGAMHKPMRRYYKTFLPTVWFTRVHPTT